MLQSHSEIESTRLFELVIVSEWYKAKAPEHHLRGFFCWYHVAFTFLLPLESGFDILHVFAKSGL